MREPIHIAAIDAGSNAIRLAIARASSAHDLEILETKRFPVRLGRRVFVRRKLEPETIREAARAFRKFRAAMDRDDVTVYRAVATSAAREATNRRALVEEIRRQAGIALEVIDGAEEARLVRSAALAAVGHSFSPRLIVDLGGGSLELNLMRGHRVERSLNLPLGTVRMMESLGMEGALSNAQVAKLRRHVLLLLRSHFPGRPGLSRETAVATGGNAEALSLLAPGPVLGGVDSMDLVLLRRKLKKIVKLGVPGRMRTFEVRKDRAEVMGIAAVVFDTLAKWARLKRFLIPRVGVREGILRDLALLHFGAEAAEDGLLTATRAYAGRLHSRPKHDEHVRGLALSLFDQLQRLHRMESEMRRLLEVAALLHDVGHAVNHKAHHRHGEYLVANGDLPGLDGWQRSVAAALVRYHNKALPDGGHPAYASLEPAQQRHVLALASLLRFAEALDRDHSQNVLGVETEMNGKNVLFRLKMKQRSLALQRSAERRAMLFEEVFRRTAQFRQSVAEPRRG